MKNRYIFFASLFILIFSSCGKYNQKIEVTDVQKPQVISLHKKVNQKSIHSMNIRGTGKLNGEAQIVLILNGQPYKTAQLNGKADFVWGGDWYADSMELRYQPAKVDSGTLVIEYRFLD